MPNSIGPQGLVVATQAELLANMTANLQSFYGADINLGSDTPDGQWLNILIQAQLDVQDLLTQINAMFDPDQAVGTILDQRVAINGIQRLAGTYTVTNVTLVTSQSVNLYGLDQSVNPVYTLSDSAGNQWELQTTQLGLSAGTNVLAFQAALPGAIPTTPNTITVQVTIVLGVTSVNNPTTYTTLGVNEESDANLRLRRQQSVNKASQGYLSGLIAGLQNINGTTTVAVYENVTSATNAAGIPGHSIWVIVGGSAPAASIAQTIYDYRNAGCGLYNSGDYAAQSYTLTQVNGLPFTVYWDGVVAEDLYIEFDATSLDGVNAPNTTAIVAYLVANYAPAVGAEVNINQLATLVQKADPNTLVTNAGFSSTSMGSYTNTLTPSALNFQFAILADNISITVV